MKTARVSVLLLTVATSASCALLATGKKAEIQYRAIPHPLSGKALAHTVYDWSSFARQCDFPIRNDTIQVRVSEKELCFDQSSNVVQVEGTALKEPDRSLTLRIRVDEKSYLGFALQMKDGFPKLAGTCVDRDGTRNSMWIVSRTKCLPNENTITASTRRLALKNAEDHVLDAWEFSLPATSRN